VAHFKCSKCGNAFTGLESSPGIVACPHCGATIVAVPYDPLAAQPVTVAGDVVTGVGAGGAAMGGGFGDTGGAGGGGAAGGSGPGDDHGPRLPCDWESNWHSDFFGAFFRQIKGVIIDPINTPGLAAPTQDYFGMALFVFLMSVVGILPGIFFQLVFMVLLQGDSEEFLTRAGFQLLSVLFLPLIAVAWQFLWAGILHVSFRYIAGSSKDYGTSFTTLALGQATAVFALIPCAGPMVHVVYGFIVGIGGMAKAHEVDTGKAVLAYLVPILICCCGLFLLYAGAIVTALSSG
jgi:DNA-directed RNA polymerase subunit RPC12/RpoP